MLDTESDETQKKRTRSEVWGTDPTCQFECLLNQEVKKKALIMKVTVNTPDIKIPKPTPMPSVPPKASFGKTLWIMNWTS